MKSLDDLLKHCKTLPEKNPKAKQSRKFIKDFVKAYGKDDWITKTGWDSEHDKHWIEAKKYQDKYIASLMALQAQLKQTPKTK